MGKHGRQGNARYDKATLSKIRGQYYIEGYTLLKQKFEVRLRTLHIYLEQNCNLRYTTLALHLLTKN